VTKLHPTAKIVLKMMGVQRAEDLARICVAVGLVQNLGALKALSTVGIVRGHMQLHAANLAIAAGAEIHEIPFVRQRLSEVLKDQKTISLTLAKEILEAHRGSARAGQHFF
jgi:hydroxymethylglutaryl-CoA reductase